LLLKKPSGSNITYGIEYDTKQLMKQNSNERYGMFIYYWDPVVSPSGMTFYVGDKIEWQNNLFIGGFEQFIFLRLVIENNNVVGEERLLADEGERFRDVQQGKDEALMQYQ
jgi:glucose/arabinose dehydrogenase